MRIIGFNLTKILVQRDEKIKSKLQITQNIDIKDIVEEKISITDDKSLKITFNLTINYSDDYAKIEFEGNVLILPNKDDFNKFLDSWKNKEIHEKMKVHLFNFIMNKCNIKALYLEDEMGLPLHIPLPKIPTEQDNSQKK